MNVVIRRRAGLMGLVAVAALAMAGAYLWRFSQHESAVALLLGTVLGLVAVAHGLALGDARTPLLVADDTGLRVRLGRDWIGLTWAQVERIEVDERGRATDGHVAVLAADLGDALDEATWRGRLGARFNRFAYDAPLVVPFGLTTSVSVVDVGGALSQLAAHRAPVVVLNAPAEDLESTVEVHHATALDQGRAAGFERGRAAGFERDRATALDQGRAAGLGVADTDVRPVPVHPPESRGLLRPADQIGGETDNGNGDGDSDVPSEGGSTRVAGDSKPGRSRPRRLAWHLPRLSRGGRRTGIEAPTAQVASPLMSTPARREEVTMPIRSERATTGTVALSDHYRDVDTEPLPEIRELRRSEPRGGDDHDEPRGNVALIIDATTDLSARAMRKVRRPEPQGPPDGQAVDSLDDAQQQRLLIGGTVTQARESLGLSVDELAERTRIRPYVIDSIEIDDFAPCGGDFYARGHLRMLGRVLGIDSDPLVQTYDDRFAAQPIDARAVFNVELSAGTTGLVRGGEPGAKWGALIATVLVIVLIWGVAQYLTDKPGREVGSNAPAQNSVGLGSPGQGNRPIGTRKEPVVKPPNTFVKVMAREGDSRVVVTDAGGETVYQGLLADGDSTHVVGAAPLRVMAVDGGVIALRIKDKQLGLMGDPGQRSVQRILASR